MNCDEILEEEEEILVVAHIPGLEEVVGSKTNDLSLEIDPTGTRITAILNNHMLLEGKFEVSLGSQVIFEEIDNSSGSSGGAVKSANCIGMSITSTPLSLNTTTDIDKINSIVAANSDAGKTLKK